MAPSTTSSKDGKGTSPAVWYVTDGDAVVGPVETDLLVRGVTHGKVTDDCWVRQESWSGWRNLDQIRELAPLRRLPAWAESTDHTAPWGLAPAYVQTMGLLVSAHDLGEVLLFGLHAAAGKVGATVGLLHRVRSPYVGLVASCARGPGVSDLLGEVVPSYDSALRMARAGSRIVGTPEGGPAERAVASRLQVCGPDLAGVAMIPVSFGGDLLAMIELGRCDHPFRATDVEAVAEIADAIVDRLEVLLKQ